ncbi:hypothetical protein K4K58_008952 [Colletotrichum sp. SAR11_239]|nr:hypothetical protein K4K58_008952 [Colletotrichum sp. SAR11_239]KAI8274684.1 hypothetical protein K4K59_010455 [Colletotrichum sp. SAR11_240]
MEPGNDDVRPFPELARTPTSEAFSSLQHIERRRYDPRSIITLYRYSPGRTHGQSRYFRNPLPEDLPSGWLRGFDPTAQTSTKTAAHIEIIRPIRSGEGGISQVHECEVVHAPRRRKSHASLANIELNGKKGPRLRLVAKFFDAMFIPGISDENLEGIFSQEDAALKRLFRKKLTGHPHLAPEYYGSWATKFVIGRDDKGCEIHRCVGVILIEYIEGQSIPQLCGIRMDNNYLVPPTGPVALHRSDTGVATVELHRDNRVQVMKQLLDGISRHIHAGVDRFHLSRRNVLITMRSNGRDLEKIRVVMLNYSLSSVWSHTKWATVPYRGKNIIEELPRPPHPAQHFGVWEWPEFHSANVLPDFCGWLSDDPIRDSHLAEFKRWLVSEEGFGEIQSTTVYSNSAIFEQLIQEKRAALQQAKEQKTREAQAETFRINAILRDQEGHSELEDLIKTSGSKMSRIGKQKAWSKKQRRLGGYPSNMVRSCGIPGIWRPFDTRKVLNLHPRCSTPNSLQNIINTFRNCQLVGNASLREEVVDWIIWLEPWEKSYYRPEPSDVYIILSEQGAKKKVVEMEDTSMQQYEIEGTENIQVL